MTKGSELDAAFDAALTLIRKSQRAKMQTGSGEDARPLLKQLEGELKAEQARSAERGAVDAEWFRHTLRWVVEWLPEDQPQLIGALGKIARAHPDPLS